MNEYDKMELEKGEYEENLKEETAYLEETLSVLKQKLLEEQLIVHGKKEELRTTNREMYENTTHFTNDFDKLIEIMQHLKFVTVQTKGYEAATQRIYKYQTLFHTPYFARIDFIEEGYDKESIYIGLSNLTDDKTHKTYIYDWRAPIASIFYRYEIGKVSFLAPNGTINGEVTRKRQYEIRNGKLLYFFDSSVTILDDILKKTLSGNTSAKMKTIVETIQREQDIIIRDIENDLVIVQGVAGSGKTSVALHRVAYLMYHDYTTKRETNNIVLISPNELFGKYIANVLPELGEKNVLTLTFEDIFAKVFSSSLRVQSRNSLLERIITSKNQTDKELYKASMEFKLSKAFQVVLLRLIDHYAHRMIPFGDIQFDGILLADRHLLKADILEKQFREVPLERRLERTENRIMKRFDELKNGRIKKLEQFVEKYTDHPFDGKEYARKLYAKQRSSLLRNIRKFTRINQFTLYQRLFQDASLFYRLAKGVTLPDNIHQILTHTDRHLKNDMLLYEDAMVLLYLKNKMAGGSNYAEFKQVVVDEAQDYYPLHWEILKQLFPYAKYTVVGDINQTVEKQADLSNYELINDILHKPKTTTIQLNKSYRCSYEISAFSQRFMDFSMAMETISRHSSPPQIIKKSSIEELDTTLIHDIKRFQELGYSSIAIVCKSMLMARDVSVRLHQRITATLIKEDMSETISGVVIIPVYLAKGLEFDAVLVYGTDALYTTQDDKKLLYIACTRALHQLTLYYTGRISSFLL